MALMQKLSQSTTFGCNFWLTPASIQHKQKNTKFTENQTVFIVNAFLLSASEIGALAFPKFSITTNALRALLISHQHKHLYWSLFSYCIFLIQFIPSNTKFVLVGLSTTTETDTKTKKRI